MRDALLTGRVATGVGLGQHFTRLDWARAQFVEKLGIDPYPGTINVIVDRGSMPLWEKLKATPGIRIDNPNDGPHDCDARCYAVSIESRIAAAIVLPEVTGYAPNLVEMIAEVGVRAALGVGDGDAVTLRLK